MEDVDVVVGADVDEDAVSDSLCIFFAFGRPKKALP
jgi:hypothetical protein